MVRYRDRPSSWIGRTCSSYVNAVGSSGLSYGEAPLYLAWGRVPCNGACLYCIMSRAANSGTVRCSSVVIWREVRDVASGLGCCLRQLGLLTPPIRLGVFHTIRKQFTIYNTPPSRIMVLAVYGPFLAVAALLGYTVKASLGAGALLKRRAPNTPRLLCSVPELILGLLRRSGPHLVIFPALEVQLIPESLSPYTSLTQRCDSFRATFTTYQARSGVFRDRL